MKVWPEDNDSSPASLSSWPAGTSSAGHAIALASPAQAFVAGYPDASSAYTIDDHMRMEEVDEELLSQAAFRWQQRGSPAFVMPSCASHGLGQEVNLSVGTMDHAEKAKKGPSRQQVAGCIQQELRQGGSDGKKRERGNLTKRERKHLLAGGAPDEPQQKVLDGHSKTWQLECEKEFVSKVNQEVPAVETATDNIAFPNPDSDETDISNLDTEQASILEALVGNWRDSKGSHYVVRLDANYLSCSVETTRPGGKGWFTKRLIRSVSFYGHSTANSRIIYWGNSFVLKNLVGFPDKVTWESTRGGRDFIWIRKESKEEKRGKADEVESETKQSDVAGFSDKRKPQKFKSRSGTWRAVVRTDDVDGLAEAEAEGQGWRAEVDGSETRGVKLSNGNNATDANREEHEGNNEEDQWPAWEVVAQKYEDELHGLSSAPCTSDTPEALDVDSVDADLVHRVVGFLKDAADVEKAKKIVLHPQSNVMPAVAEEAIRMHSAKKHENNALHEPSSAPCASDTPEAVDAGSVDADLVPRVVDFLKTADDV